MTKSKKITPWRAHKIVVRKLEELVPSPKNSREHPPEQIRLLRNSLKEFGFTKPILIDDKYEIIAGHGVALAAKAEGLVDVPTITAEGWSEEQKRAYRLFDNWSATQSIWIPDMVESEITELTELDFNLEPLGLDGFSLQEEIEDLPPQAQRAPKTKTTLFVSIKNQDVEKARKIIIAALNKEKIEHNL